MPNRTGRRARARCKMCGQPTGLGTVHLSGDEGLLCSHCFNDERAKSEGLAFDNTRLEPVTIEDDAGHPHTFEIVSMLGTVGHSMRAIETGVSAGAGYRFQVLGDYEEDALVLCGRLCAAIRAGLARRSLKHDRLGPALARKAQARISCSMDITEPVMIVDGQAFTWQEFGRMLLTYEGWTVEMSFDDGIEMVGKPRGLERDPEEH